MLCGCCAVYCKRGEFCVLWVRGYMGVYLICLLLSRCCPPRHLYPCNTEATIRRSFRNVSLICMQAYVSEMQGMTHALFAL